MTQTQPQKVLKLEKIVSVGAAEYATSVGINLHDYKLIGVQVVARGLDPRPVFLKNLPEGTEAVVGFRMSGVAYEGLSQFSADMAIHSTTVKISYAYGTALVKKSEADKPE